MPSAPRIGALVTTLAVLCGALASCTSTARISDVYMALDGNGDRKRTLFFTDSKEIHCVVEAGIGRPGVTLEVIIRELQAYDFVDDRSFPTNRVALNAEISPARGNGIQKTDIVFNPRAPDGSDAAGAPYPRGRFQCEAYLDGTLEQAAIFSIEFADCPSATIRPGTACFGFYKRDTQCPRYGASAGDNAQCRCSPTKGWECD